MAGIIALFSFLSILICVGAVALITAVYAVMMILFAIGLTRLRRNRIVEHISWPSVSVIVPARNEADVLPWTLGSLMRQDYPGKWEVIVVDDRSDDAQPRCPARIIGRLS